jgi:oligopeptide/dipeptide ABC transporter ATP-binding protein
VSPPLLDVRALRVALKHRGGPLPVVDGVDVRVERGEAVALVGESGCGKSMTAFALMGLFPTPAASVTEGEIVFEGRDLVTLDEAARRAVRGARIGMIFQDPASFLDPLMPVGRQIAEALEAHGRSTGITARVHELLHLMELPEAAAIARRYPHELSGGMRQRVLIAAAIAMDPALLIADEPTTALDVTVQASILALLSRLRARLGLGLLLITHDLGVVAETCDRVYVMYAGRIVETHDVRALFAAPRHPYTQGLLASTLTLEGRRGALFSIPGRVPRPRAMPRGCRFHPRCPIAMRGLCDTSDPVLAERPGGGADACLRALDPAAARAWPLAA